MPEECTCTVRTGDRPPRTIPCHKVSPSIIHVDPHILIAADLGEPFEERGPVIPLVQKIGVKLGTRRQIFYEAFKRTLFLRKTANGKRQVRPALFLAYLIPARCI